MKVAPIAGRSGLVDDAAGFTMIELLAVVLVIAIVAGAIIYAQGGTREHAALAVARSEMVQIRDAIAQYQVDTGSVPSPENPADFSFLFARGAHPVWNAYVSRGWNGPYLRSGGEGYVDIGDSLSESGTGDPGQVNASPIQNVRGVADPFVMPPVVVGGGLICDASYLDASCLLDWRSTPSDPRHERWGRPYFVFALNDFARARLVSSGPNGLYESQSCAAMDCSECSPPGDDIILCLGS